MLYRVPICYYLIKEVATLITRRKDIGMISFGQKIKKIRTDAGFSQAYLAELIGVSAQSVSNWECDNTMPDISQIVPLAGALSVSTDFLLGVGTDEESDKKRLEENVTSIWATYSVNTKENNADLLVIACYEDYLRKYPMAYDVKYKCALALHDYVKVVEERKKFEAETNQTDEAYTKCDRYLESVIGNADDLELKINAGILRVSHLLMRENYQEARQTAEKLPDISGIKQASLSSVLYRAGKDGEAKTCALKAAKAKCLDYLFSLYDMVLNENYNAIDVLNNAEAVSKQAVEMYSDITALKVNDYESVPYCYLITAYTMKCNYFINEGNLDQAFESLYSAVATASEMYEWVKKQTTDEQVLEDYKFFKENVPCWAYRFSKNFDSDDNIFTQDIRYKKPLKIYMQNREKRTVLPAVLLLLMN